MPCIDKNLVARDEEDLMPFLYKGLIWLYRSKHNEVWRVGTDANTGEETLGEFLGKYDPISNSIKPAREPRMLVIAE